MIRTTFVLAVSLSLLSTAKAEIIGLGGLLPWQISSRAYGVSDDGTTVVGQSGGSSGSEAFRWTQASGMVGLGSLSGNGSEALGISADGSTIVGRSLHSSFTIAFRWTASDGMVGIGDLPGGEFRSSARGVSDDGQFVVDDSRSGNGDEAFIGRPPLE